MPWSRRASDGRAKTAVEDRGCCDRFPEEGRVDGITQDGKYGDQSHGALMAAIVEKEAPLQTDPAPVESTPDEPVTDEKSQGFQVFLNILIDDAVFKDAAFSSVDYALLYHGPVLLFDHRALISVLQDMVLARDYL